MKKQARGSALIISFLLIAAVGGTALSIGRLFLMDQSTAQIYEDSIVAYYAAESGIEEAMLRYRYNKNVEVPTESGIFNSDMVLRTNLTDADSENVYPNSALSTSGATDIKYDLKVTSFGKIFGNDVNENNIVDTNDYITIQRDEAIKLDVSKTIGGLKIYVKYVSPTNTAFFEAKLTGKVGDNLTEFKKALLFQDPSDAASRNMFPDSDDYVKFVKNGDLYSLDDLKTAIADSTLFDDGEVILSLKAINTTDQVKVALQATASGGQIPLPNTLVTSTGYYGRNSRTLKAKIDRQSGTVYDLFDYVIYDKN